MKKNRSFKKLVAASLSATLTAGYIPMSVLAYSASETTKAEEKPAVTSTVTTAKTKTESTSKTEAKKSDAQESASAKKTADKKAAEQQKVTYCNIELNLNGEGKILVNGEEKKSLKAKAGDKAVITVELPEEGSYRLDSLCLDGKEVEAEEEDERTYTYEYEVTEDAPEKVCFSADVSQIYTVSVRKDSDKGVVIDAVEDENTEKMGELDVDGDEKIVAKPFENYCVSDILIGGVKLEKDEFNVMDDASVVIDFDKEKDISVVFAPVSYKITSETDVNGNIELSTDDVVANGEFHVTVTTNQNCYIKAIYINDQYYDPTQGLDNENFHVGDYADGKFKISGVNTDINVRVECVRLSGIKLDDVKIESGQGKKDGNHYIVAKGQSVKFSTNERGIVLFDENGKQIGGSENSNTAEVYSSCQVKKIVVYFEKTNYGDSKSQELELPDPVTVEFIDGVRIETTPEELKDGNTFYTDDTVKVRWDAVNPLNEKIEKIVYWVDNDYENSKTIEPTLNEDGTKTFTDEDHYISIDTSKYKGENVKLKIDAYVEGKDVAVQTKETTLKIAPDVPEIISITGNVNNNPDADEEWYEGEREIVIRIKDKSYTQLESNSAFTIERNGIVLTDGEKKKYITWNKSGDELIATLKIQEQGKFGWYFAYKNKAGLKAVNKDVEKEPGHYFNIRNISDDDLGNCYFTVNKVKRNDLADVLTFGFFSKEECTLDLNVAQKSSVKEIAYYREDYNGEKKLYKTSVDIAAKIKELDKLYADGKFTVSNKYEYDLKDNTKSVVYARILYKTGTVKYVSSDGIILDQNKPNNISVTFDTKNAYINEDKKPVFFDDIPVHISVSDPAVGDEAVSGINYIDCYIQKNSQALSETFHVYKWNPNAGNAKIENGFELDYSIPKNKKYSDSDLELVVNVHDNSGNVYIYTTRKFDLNLDESNVALKFDDTQDNNDKYFKTRSAELQFTFKGYTGSELFDEKSAEDAIKNYIQFTPSADVPQPETPIRIGDWKIEKNIAVTTIYFEGEGKYTLPSNLQLGYVNNMNRPVNDFIVQGREAREFYVDPTIPEGKITIEGNAWKDLIETITFGIFKSKKNDDDGFSATITASDQTSPVKIEYYIATDGKSYSKDDLDNIENDKWTTYDDPISSIKHQEAIKLSDAGKYVVYARLTDRAGNRKYICSDGHIIDSKASTIDLTFDEPTLWKQKDGKDVPVFNSDFKQIRFNIDCKETESDNAGIKFIKYWFTTEAGDYALPDEGNKNLLFEAENGELIDEISREVVIDTAAYNRSDLVLHVLTEDNAGNQNETTQSIDIDVTVPEVKLEFIDDAENDIVEDDDTAYFNKSRHAKITIIERPEHFDEEAVKNSINITGKDKNGTTYAPIIRGWDSDDSDKNVHTLNVDFLQSAIYSIDINYSDTAKNKCEKVEVPEGTKAPFNFVVDNEKPYGKLHIETAENDYRYYEDLKDDVRYIILSKEWIKSWCDRHDDVSPITEVKYFKSTRNTAYTTEELDNVTSWKDFEEFLILPNEQAVIYAKIADKAGNVRYLSSDGIIVDDITPHTEMDAPVITLVAKQDTDGIYNGDVNVKVKVEEPASNGVYSGLRHIEYSVLNMGSTTDSQNMYDYNIPFPDKDQLERKYEQDVVIRAEDNNSNDVILRVEATDRAGNTSVQDLPLKIDITAPTLDVAYSDSKKSRADDAYFTSRTATFTINERNFDSRNVSLAVYKDNVYMPVILDWTESGSSTSPQNGDGKIYTATLPFTTDGAYRYEMSFVDIAGNNSRTLNEGTFVVDNTPPDVRLNFDRNNNNQPDPVSEKGINNGGIYNAPRELSITIDEKNFSENNVNLTITKTVDGQRQTPPAVGEWQKTQSGRTTKVKFDEDGDYSVKLRVTDEAGNTSSDAKNNDSEFTIDTTDPVVELTVNGKKITDTDLNGAYSGKIIPEIKYSDINLDPDSVKIKLSAANVEVDEAEISNDTITFNLKDKNGKSVAWKGKVEDVLSDNGNTIGKKIVMDDFPDNAKMKDFDDIYTFKVSASDKAKRKTVNEMTFSVNRFGSTYDISGVGNIVGKYIKETVDVSISEYNANKLKEIRLTVFRNNESNVLKENEDFHVVSEGGEGNWYKYTYTIPKEYFEDDGVYKISVRSVDSANNISENNLESKGKEISFGIDSEAPKIIPVNIESDKTYAEDKKDFIFTVSDNLNVEEVSAVLDNNEPIVWKDEDLKKIISGNGEFMITVDGNSNQAHQLKLVCKDSAGNSSESIFDDFYVTTNLAVRFLHNKGILAGAAALVAAIVGGVIVFFKKKRS